MTDQNNSTPVFDDYPEFNASAMGCGLEDRNIHDRYDAMRYGWDEAIERVGERIGLFLADFSPAATPAVPAVDALTRYSHWFDEAGSGVAPSPDGEFVKIADVQALLATPSTAPDRHPLADEYGCWGLYAESVLAAGAAPLAGVPAHDAPGLTIMREALEKLENGALNVAENAKLRGDTYDVGYAEAMAKCAREALAAASADPEQAKLDSLAQAGLAAALENRARQPKAAPVEPKPPCRMQGGICACRSGGSYGGCAIERGFTTPFPEAGDLAAIQAAPEATSEQSAPDLSTHEGRLNYIRDFGNEHLTEAVRTGQIPIHKAIAQIDATATTEQMGGAQVAKGVPVELVGVREQIEEGAGFWHSCSGCHETEDGHPVGRYSYSDTMRCALGNGCSECGGIGAIWDNNDYEEMAKDWDKDAAPTEIAAEGEATERKPLTPAQIWQIVPRHNTAAGELDPITFTRAIEQHHGITGGGK